MIGDGDIVDFDEPGAAWATPLLRFSVSMGLLQGVDDRLDIVPHHAHVSSFRRAGLAHGVGEQFAADRHFVAPAAAAFDQSLDVPFG